MNAHSVLVNDVLLKIGGLSYCRVFKQHVGTFIIPDTDIRIKIGIRGQSDIYGMLRSNSGIAYFLAMECKTGNAVQTKWQKNYEQMVKDMGGIYLLVRDANDALIKVKLLKESLI